ncbi:MAG: C39 family peptidase [Candidatus Magasanikbacteria bacterium]|nr:C39 family peptidase [Candidatus Magasanikbacteria bacterium]
MRRYWLINLTCVILSAGFLFGIFLVWRGESEVDYEAELGVVNGEMEYGTLNIEQKEFVTTTFLTSQTLLSPVVTVSSSKKRVATILPAQYLLPVPFTSQAPEKNWDQPWQDACEEAAVLMLDAYYKGYGLSPLFAKDEILKMIKWEEDGGWGSSIEIEKVARLAEWYLSPNHLITSSPHHLRIVENPTVEQIKTFIADSKPVLVVADGKVLPNLHFRNGGPVYHALIIRGYTETEFITNDPGTQFGRGFKYKYEDLLNAVHDWNGGDVKNGKRAVLIID